METRHALRRLAALKIIKARQGHARVAASFLKDIVPRRELTDPLFNWREIAKQMVLLEDHLFHGYKQCADCIKKHLLTIEAFAEEIPTLCLPGKGGKPKMAEELAEQCRKWMEQMLDGADLSVIGTEIRMFRKKLVPGVADPRGSSRVAAVYLRRSEKHSH
jgi:hypothetical protein